MPLSDVEVNSLQTALKHNIRCTIPFVDAGQRVRINSGPWPAWGIVISFTQRASSFVITSQRSVLLELDRDLVKRAGPVGLKWVDRRPLRAPRVWPKANIRHASITGSRVPPFTAPPGLGVAECVRVARRKTCLLDACLGVLTALSSQAPHLSSRATPKPFNEDFLNLRESIRPRHSAAMRVCTCFQAELLGGDSLIEQCPFHMEGRPEFQPPPHFEQTTPGHKDNAGA
jgi:hypothetical protein